MGTYKEIQNYVYNKYGIHIQTCWIAHIKEKQGILSKTASNRIDKNNRVKPCPNNKERYIIEALKFFKMI